jgi:hypothetical protein
MIRICVNVKDEVAERLKKRATLTGVVLSEQVRRAIEADFEAEDERRSKYAFGRGNQFAANPEHSECCLSADPSKKQAAVLVANKDE